MEGMGEPIEHAVVILGSPVTLAHPVKLRLVVMTTQVCL
jgi:hypothetical protein